MARRSNMGEIPAPRLLGAGRIEGIDLWRGLLLSYGIVVHAATLSDDMFFTLLRDLSSLFRMEAFFCISGVLAAVTVVRAPADRWALRRFVIIGVPLVFGLAILNPLALAIIADSSAGDGFMADYASRTPLAGHLHLWFLVCLLGYTAMVWAWRALPEARVRTLVRTYERFSIGSSGLLVSLILLAVLARTFGAGVARLVHVEIGYPIAVLGYFAIFYFAGYAIVRNAKLRAIVMNPPSSIFVLGLAALILTLWLSVSGVSFGGDDYVRRLTKATVSVCACLVILRHALTMERAHPFFRTLAAAAFTIYLIHYLALQVMLNWLSGAGASAYLAFAITVPTVFFVTLGFHTQVVARVPPIRFLLNGRWSEQSAKPAKRSA